jgi:hypothetical protein
MSDLTSTPASSPLAVNLDTLFDAVNLDTLFDVYYLAKER